MATWIVGGILLLIVGAVVFKMIRDRRHHKCSCGCSHCSGGCHGC
ncbi:MAG TPA: FeoB-associated Cys-rich membrane protein [Candidatus Limiplasma stercoravium]|nr:FeoB-associated Cys-rich membrane protein [Candidatus Limiplasma stercoravium]